MTDNNPLEMVKLDPLEQRWMAQLSKFNFKIGRDAATPMQTLSRYPVEAPSGTTDEEREENEVPNFTSLLSVGTSAPVRMNGGERLTWEN